MPPRSDVLRRIDVGVFLMATGPAAEHCLGRPVVRADVPAGRTGLAGVGRRHQHPPAALPLELVIELTHELAPALVQNGPVQPGLGPDVPAGFIEGACRRPAHVPHVQVLDKNHRLVLADGRRGLVQEVLPAAGNLVVKPLNPPLLPVGRERHLAGQGALRPGQFVLMLVEGVERRMGGPVGQGGEGGHAQVDAGIRNRWVDRFRQFLLHLNGDIPVTGLARDRGVLDLAGNVLAFEEPDPADFGQVDAAVVQFHALRVAKRCMLVLPLLARQPLERLVLVEGIPVRPIQILQGLLKRLGVNFAQKSVLLALFPELEPKSRLLIPDEGPFVFQAMLIHAPDLVPHPAAATGLAKQFPLQIRIGLEAEFIGFADQHRAIVVLVYG